ncbi:hypothetical protein [Erythrobacter sp. MTPC3]|uniref:hypothetical protein n=1 Tax=Erythrobacter sp. MTPC3 TaxID=3056564 RepID=UPI0036F1AF2F
MTNQSDRMDKLVQDLEQQARSFAARNSGEEGRSTRSLIVADFEFLWDRSRHHGYKTQEGKDAAPIRWPFDRIAASSWIALNFVAGEKSPRIEGPFIRTMEDGNEVGIVESLFEALRADPRASFVTWGGEFRDLPVLRRCATENGLILPEQLRNLSPHAGERVDLCRAVAGLADNAHLGEYAAALSIPAKPIAASSIGKLVERGEWTPVREQCLADTLATALLAVRHWVALGQITCDQMATDLAIVDAAHAAQPNSEFVTRTLKPWVRARHARSRLKGSVYHAADSVIREGETVT